MKQKIAPKVVLCLMITLLAMGTLASPVFASAPNIEKAMPSATGEMPGMIAVTESVEPVILSPHPQDLLDIILDGALSLLNMLGPFLVGLGLIDLLMNVLGSLLGPDTTALLEGLLPILVPSLAA
jgi:hypothetical protein